MEGKQFANLTSVTSSEEQVFLDNLLELEFAWEEALQLINLLEHLEKGSPSI